MTNLKSGWLGLVLVLAPLAPCAEFNAPPPTPRQIEADWLLQDAKRIPSTAVGRPVTPQEDAAGGVDGIKNGQWGFHTDHEQNPWWQVGLEQSTALDRLVLYNRSDFAERDNRIVVSVSDDGKEYCPVYQHDGTAGLAPARILRT